MTIIQRLKLIILFIFVTFSFFDSALASNFSGKWFTVEMIIFSHFQPRYLDSEQWPNITPVVLASDKSIQLNQPSEQIKLLPAVDYKLDGLVKKISKNSSYKVLAHVLWQQKIMQPNLAIPIHFFAKGVLNNASLHNLKYDPNQVWDINGTITLSVVKYLNASFNLYFSEDASYLSKIATNHYFDSAQGSVYFNFKQSRRMKSKEINYLDSPNYGVLIYITRG